MGSLQDDPPLFSVEVTPLLGASITLVSHEAAGAPSPRGSAGGPGAVATGYVQVAPQLCQ